MGGQRIVAVKVITVTACAACPVRDGCRHRADDAIPPECPLDDYRHRSRQRTSGYDALCLPDDERPSRDGPAAGIW